MEHLSYSVAFIQFCTYTGYQRIITSASYNFPLKDWFRYDRQFHTMAASNPYLRWDQHHQELWYKNMSNNSTTQRWPCLHCGAKNHYPDNCPHLPFCEDLQRSRPPNCRTPRAPVCGDFNNRQCTRNARTYQIFASHARVPTFTSPVLTRATPVRPRPLLIESEQVPLLTSKQNKHPRAKLVQYNTTCVVLV